MGVDSLQSFALTAPGIAEATTTAGYFKNTYAFTAVVDGRAVYKAATTDVAMVAYTGTSFTALAAKQTCALFYMMTAGGVVTVLQSAIVPSTASATYRAGAWEWPTRTGFVCIGATVVRTDNAATYTPNVTDLGATDVVDTHYDAVLGVYGKPITY